jgi:hypothetical protein
MTIEVRPLGGCIAYGLEQIKLLMPGRLLEVPPDRAAWLRARLRAACDRVLVCAYDDWRARYGSLRGLVDRVGLRLVRDEGPAGLAEVP